MNREQRRAKEQGKEPPGKPQVEEQDIHAAARPQDVESARAKGSRHKKVTADKWNQ